MEETIEAGKERVAAQIRTGYETVKDPVGQTAETVKRELNTAAKVAKDEARAMADDATCRTNAALRDARSTVQANPEKWLLIAMGAGVVLGACTNMMMRRVSTRPRRSDKNSY